MLLMRRLVSRSSRSLAVMVGAATSGRGHGKDCLRGRPRRAAELLAAPPAAPRRC